MHGVSKQITILVEVLGTAVNPMNKKNQIGLETEFTIKASDYGVNSWDNFSAVLGDEVDIEVLIEANAG
jgi:polyisoprenoid-binding protein YceI